jgi:dTDP-glucose pyrophosphorylase
MAAGAQGGGVTTVVVTMAGESRRFRDAGFKDPKYRLTVGGRTIFAWALESLRWYAEQGASFVLIGRADDPGLGDFVARECALLGFPPPELVCLDGTTSGQAETVLAAEPFIAADEPIVIYNIDTHVRPGAFGADTLAGDGCIPCFPGNGDGWSFVRCDGAGRVVDVREKKRISPHCSVGLYAFRDLATYRAAYDRTAPVRDERYVAPLYATLLDDGCDIRMTTLDAHDVVPLGTPDEARRASDLRAA